MITWLLNNWAKSVDTDTWLRIIEILNILKEIIWLQLYHTITEKWYAFVTLLHWSNVIHVDPTLSWRGIFKLLNYRTTSLHRKGSFFTVGITELPKYMMRTWQPCLCPCVVHGLEKMESSKVFQVKKEVQGWSGSSPRGGGQKQFKFGSSSESRSSAQ
jgi:hypothetical protein